jgi:hypothetical protein
MLINCSQTHTEQSEMRRLNFTLKYQLIAHCFNKTHAKIRRSNPLKFFYILLHVSILKDHHQGVNVPIYEVIEYFLFFC